MPTDPIARLRHFRTHRDPDLSIHDTVSRMASQWAKTHKQLGQVAELWETYVPEPLAGRTRLVSLLRGVLTVEAADASTLYELDRLLRSGLQRTLREGLKTGSLSRVKLRVGSFERSQP